MHRPTTRSLSKAKSVTNDKIVDYDRKVRAELKPETDKKNLEKELHENRVKMLLEVVKQSKDDAWKYQSLEEIFRNGRQ
ncbi:unnamed protein product [Bursaphelenchus xylophilus]|uniref:(pine wood nematode) hypothetical protein n=1 Tax=Bursaphelenchus xylophilus TaxID=6326 RepID=A0A1I7RIJ5_BURXY|nr:unnamed protein product [Bursaphelenchus xylophilus]CAG9118812.1 unnamed protein product [Bursaphelenchus xylophilus]